MNSFSQTWLSRLIVTAFLVMAVSATMWNSKALVKSWRDSVLLEDAQVVDATILNMERVNKIGVEGKSDVDVYVTYQYEIDGREYRQRTRRLVLFDSNTAVLKDIERGYELQQPVRCYVAKRDPNLSVFSRDFSTKKFWLSAMIPLGFGSILAVIAVSEFRKWRARS